MGRPPLSPSPHEEPHFIQSPQLLQLVQTFCKDGSPLIDDIFQFLYMNRNQLDRQSQIHLFEIGANFNHLFSTYIGEGDSLIEAFQKTVLVIIENPVVSDLIDKALSTQITNIVGGMV
jgi:hypothetical protein